MTFAEYEAEFDAFWEDPENDMEIDSWMLTYHGPMVLAAYGYNKGLNVEEVEDWWSEAEEAFTGTYSSDTVFAQEFADSTSVMWVGEIPWPYNCIDWEAAAQDLMVDYFEEQGFYFRNL